MTTTKINRGGTPSQQIADQAAAPVSVQDSAGTVIGLRNPGVLAQFRLVKMLGGQTARNDVYMQMILPLLYVYSINGADIAPLGSELEIEALIQRLGEGGVAAVIDGVQKNFGKADPEAQRDEIKK